MIRIAIHSHIDNKNNNITSEKTRPNGLYVGLAIQKSWVQFLTLTMSSSLFSILPSTSWHLLILLSSVWILYKCVLNYLSGVPP